EHRDLGALGLDVGPPQLPHDEQPEHDARGDEQLAEHAGRDHGGLARAHQTTPGAAPVPAASKTSTSAGTRAKRSSPAPCTAGSSSSFELVTDHPRPTASTHSR